MSLTIIIGEKNYSSWSLRGWLAVAHTGLPFDEIKLALDTPEFYRDIKEYSPTGRVPALRHGEINIWDSAAIIDYCAHIAPEKFWWPSDSAAYAFARSICAEMHSGFTQLRTHAPMNMWGRWTNLNISSGVLLDVARIDSLWQEARTQFGAGGDFLFGSFSAADMMYAPVVSRFITYDIEVSAAARQYAEAIFNHPAFQAWYTAAKAEETIVRADELSRAATHLGPLE